MTAPVITATKRANSNSIAQYASGKLDSDSGTAAAYIVHLGFAPRKVRFVNLTDRIEYEWFAGMTNPGAVKTAAAGTRTLETTEGITVVAAGAGGATSMVEDPGLHSSDANKMAMGGVDGNYVSFPAALMVASKSFAWEAIG